MLSEKLLCDYQWIKDSKTIIMRQPYAKEQRYVMSRCHVVIYTCTFFKTLDSS